jgi:hypothetical protein
MGYKALRFRDGCKRPVTFMGMVDPVQWIEHRRGGDGELIGWMVPDGEGFVVVDLLGRERSDVVDWLTAEETLDEIGLSFLADPFELRLPDGRWLQVRIAELSPEGIRVTRDDWGVSDVQDCEFELLFPMREELRPVADWPSNVE